MFFRENDLQNLQKRVTRYKEVLDNTNSYREAWQKELKANIITQLKELCEKVGLNATVETREEMTNLEAIVLTLGVVDSGLGEPIVAGGRRRDLIKHNGALIYQQLFNGKILVMINFPFIEKYGQPQQPKQVAIYRPEEIKEPYLLRHLETFVTEISQWEDYDDDQPAEQNQRIGFQLNFNEEKKT
jgi:hypothetical protein